jgi:hypothetical protein
MGKACSPNGKNGIAYRLLVKKAEGKKRLGRPSCRWMDNIRMDLGEVEWGYVDWIGLAQDRNSRRAFVEFSSEPSGSIKCWETIEWLLMQFSVPWSC